MATTTPRITGDQNEDFVIPPNPDDPGYLVESLLAAGESELADAELERLMIESLESGEAVEMNADSWKELREELHRQAGIA